MKKLSLRVVSVLLILHGATTFVAAKMLPISAIHDRLLFAQHGFSFIFLGLLNIVIWTSAASGRFMRPLVHLSNLGFLLYYVALSSHTPEPPNYVATILIGAV